MKTLVSHSTLPTPTLLTLTIGCALACLPLGLASAQDAGTDPASKPGAAAVATPEPAATAAPETAGTTAAAKLTHQETEFVTKAGAGNAAEVKVAGLAEANAESQDVKDFAAKMTKDHGDANTDLEPIAKAHDIAFPPEPMAAQKMQYEKLAKLKGKAFDKAYVKDMVMDHEKDLAAYKKAKSEVKDADLKAYVEKTEPVVAEHLKMIKEIESKMMSGKKS
jgi:putative membrane protein